MGVIQKLAAAQIEFPPIIKNAINPHFKSRFADLATIKTAVDPVLRKHGLFMLQTVVAPPALRTLVREIDGDESYVCDIPLILTKQDPQALGSAITYARRYGYTTLLGLVAEDDDDGNAASDSAPAVETFTLEGWLSVEDRDQAHAELAEQMKQASQEVQAAGRGVVREHGWPMSFNNFVGLKSLLQLEE